MDVNLDKLKHEVQAYLETSDFAVFRSIPHGLEGLPMVLWDVARTPDYQAFLDVARKAGVKIVMFATAAFQESELDELEDQIEELEIEREEQREFQSRVRVLRSYQGETCTLELAFDYNQRLYVFDIQPPWYDDFVALEDEVAEHMAEMDLDEDDDDDSLGGFYSKN